MKSTHPALFAAFAMALASCGGEDGPAPSPSPSPANQAPAFSTGNQDLSVVENSAAVLFVAQASDPDGDSVQLSLSGVDGALFAINGERQVAFRQPPNFDLPQDQDGDNVYRFTVSVSDGQASDSISAMITVTNDREGISVSRIATGFDDPVGMDWTDDARGLIVGESDGTVWRVDGATGNRSQLAQIPLTPEGALMDAAFGRQGAFLPGLVVMSSFDNGVSVFRPNANIYIDRQLAAGDPGEAKGTLWFSQDGGLYAAVGDPTGDRAQGDSGYGRLFFPSPDPNAGASLRGLPIEAVGNGIRRPGGMGQLGSFYLVADQGASNEYEISMFVIDERPLNFGWPFFEGTVAVRSGTPADLIEPTLVYPVGDDPSEGSGVVMGEYYRGAITGILDHFVLGDTNGTIWSLEPDNLRDGEVTRADMLENRSADFLPDAGRIDSVVEIALDAAGVLYILDADGELFRVDPA